MEQMLTEENFIKAEKLMAKNKKKNFRAKRIARQADKYGKKHKENFKSVIDSKIDEKNAPVVEETTEE